MNFLKKNWYWLIPLVFLAAYAAYIWAQNRKASKRVEENDTTGLNVNAVLFNGVPGFDAEIRYLQTWLNKKGQSVDVDGRFGPKTAAALFAVTGKYDTTLKDLPK